MLPGGSVAQNRLQPATRFLQPVPLVQHLDLYDLKVSFEQSVARDLLDQVEGSLALLVGQAQLTCLQRRHCQVLPDLDEGKVASRPAHPLFGLQQPRDEQRSLLPDGEVKNEV